MIGTLETTLLFQEVKIANTEYGINTVDNFIILCLMIMLSQVLSGLPMEITSLLALLRCSDSVINLGGLIPSINLTVDLS